MSKLATTTFLVSDVEPATTPLLVVPYKEAVEALLRTAIPACRSRSVEACARYHGHLIAGVPFHPVAAAAHRAFMDHRPLCLSPDIMWLMICRESQITSTPTPKSYGLASSVTRARSRSAYGGTNS